MELSKEELIKISIATFTDTIKRIIFSLQVADLVKKGILKPEHFTKTLSSQGSIIGYADWTKNPEDFKKTSDDVQFTSLASAITLCKEIYKQAIGKTFANEKDNRELYSAQMILKIIRNALAHILAISNKLAKPVYKIEKREECKLYEVKSIGVTLDTSNLYDVVEEFNFDDLGGLLNFIKLLNYLKNDLENRINQPNYPNKTTS